MRVYVIRMLQYGKIDVSEGIDTNKTSALKECTLESRIIGGVGIIGGLYIVIIINKEGIGIIGGVGWG